MDHYLKISKTNNQIEKKVKILKGKIRILNEKNEINKCLKTHLKIINLLKSQDDLYFKEIYFKSLNEIGQLLYQKLAKPKEAIQYFLDSIDLLQSMDLNENHLKKIYYDLFNCYYMIGDTKNIIEYGDLVLNTPELDDQTKFKINNIIGRFYLVNFFNTDKQANLIRAYAYSINAVNIAKQNNQIPLTQYINSLYDCGECCHYLEDLELAIKYFDEIISLSKEITISNDLMFGLYSHLVQIYTALGYKETVFYYNRKIEELESN